MAALRLAETKEPQTGFQAKLLLRMADSYAIIKKLNVISGTQHKKLRQTVPENNADAHNRKP